MQLPPSDHVCWKLLRLVVVGGIMMILLKYNYANGWAAADWGTLITLLLAVGGFDVVKTMTAPKG